MKGQNPIPEKVMTVYKQVLMEQPGGWCLITWMTDSYGRTWSTKLGARPPELALGEQLRPEEMEWETVDG
jgi:hypothetical protein